MTLLTLFAATENNDETARGLVGSSFIPPIRVNERCKPIRKLHNRIVAPSNTGRRAWNRFTSKAHSRARARRSSSRQKVLQSRNSDCRPSLCLAHASRVRVCQRSEEHTSELE